MKCVTLVKKYLHHFPLIFFPLFSISIKTTELECRLCMSEIGLYAVTLAFTYIMNKDILYSIKVYSTL